MSKFAVIEESPVDATTKTQGQPAINAVSIQMLTMALKALSARAVAALSYLWREMFTAAGLYSAWYLWQAAGTNPSVSQLIGLGMYGMFILALELVRRRQ